MAETGKKLTFFEAAAIVTGYGIGGGVMAVPFLASRSGLVPVFVMLALAYGLSLLLHFMVAEAMLRDGKSAQMVELFNKYLFRGRFAKPLMWAIFTLIVLAFIASLSAYIAGGARIVSGLAGVPLWAGCCVIYGVAAAVAFFGLKVLGMSEKYAVAAMFALLLGLVVTALGRPFSLEFSITGGAQVQMALFGMIMFSFFSLFSVPQVADGLRWNKRLIPGAIAVGLGLNGLMTLIMVLLSLGVSKEVNPIAIIGLGQAMGGWVKTGGEVFILLAMLMPYMSISFALAVVVEERVGWNQKLCWLLATLPTFAIVVTGVSDFLGFIRIAGGAIAVLVSIMLVPLLNSVRRLGPVKEPEWKMGFWGTWPFQLIVLAGYVLMAAGSLIAVK